MPIMTMLERSRPSGGDGHSPSASRASITWPTISAADRLRTRRCVPVWQNLQVSVQPTCEETQSVPRSSSGMWTHLDFLPVGEAQQPFARAVDRLFVDRHRPAAPRHGARPASRAAPSRASSWRRTRSRRDGRSSARAGGRGSSARRAPSITASSSARSRPTRFVASVRRRDGRRKTAGVNGRAHGCVRVLAPAIVAGLSRRRATIAVVRGRRRSWRAS